MEPQQPQPSISPPPSPLEVQLPEQKSASLFTLLSAGGALVFVISASIAWYWFEASSPKMSDMPVAKIEAQKVVIGYTPWPGYIAFFVARDKGYFADEGLDVELKNYPSLAQTAVDYKAGLIQGVMNLGLDTIHQAETGLDHKAVLLIDDSKGSDGIIAGPGIKDFAGIKGKKVAYEFGTLEEFFLRYALEEHGLSLSDIQSVNHYPEAAADALIKKEVDVAVTYEPFMSRAMFAAGGSKIYSSAQAPGLITDILTFRTDFIVQNPNTIAAMIRAYFKAIDFIKFNPAEAHRILAEAYGISTDDVVAQLDGVKVSDQDRNRAAFSPTSAQSLYVNLQSIAQFVQAVGKEEKPFDTATLIEPAFVNTYLGVGLESSDRVH